MRRTGYGRKALWAYLQKNSKLHLCILVAALLGLVSAAVYAFLMPQASSDELLLYVQDFFGNISQSGTDSGNLLKTAFFMNGRNLIFLLLCSLMVIGAPLIAIFVAVSCFMHGFTLFFLFRIYSLRAVLFFILGMLPHYLLQVPTYWLLCMLCLQFSLELSREKYDFKKRLLPFLGKVAGLFCLAMMSALLQAYVEPFLIGLIAQLYM